VKTAETRPQTDRVALYRDAIHRHAEQCGYVATASDPLSSCGRCLHGSPLDFMHEAGDAIAFCHELCRVVSLTGTCTKWCGGIQVTLLERLVSGCFDSLRNLLSRQK
jgi:hypothetical protein